MFDGITDFIYLVDTKQHCMSYFEDTLSNIQRISSQLMQWLIRVGHIAIFSEMVMAGRCFAPASESSCAARPWPPWGYPAPVQPPLWPLTSASAGIHWTVADAFLSAAQSSCVSPLPSSGNQVFPEFICYNDFSGKYIPKCKIELKCN